MLSTLALHAIGENTMPFTIALLLLFTDPSAGAANSAWPTTCKAVHPPSQESGHAES